MLNINHERKTKNKLFFVLLLTIPIIIYFYFLVARTDAIYGDDLYIFKNYFGLKNFFQKINMPVSFGKYRPVHGLSLFFVIEAFQRNLEGYYLFNIGIQTLNTFLFALLANLFLKSPYPALGFSLIVGLSRFSFFNISQLFNGGALEGLAMTFFLLSLFYIVKALIKKGDTAAQKQKSILFSILFANLSMYTHERYIVLFPFLILVIAIFPTLKTLTQQQRIRLGLIGLASIVVNVAIKKYIFAMPFFMGTGGASITFSFATASAFFSDALLSIFQINSGPDYLVGRSFSSLPPLAKTAVIVLCSSFFLILAIYLKKVWKAYTLGEKANRLHFPLFLSLAVLLGLFLIPAVVTIRLEQRWLQAPFSIFVLMTVMALSTLQFKNNFNRHAFFASFILLFLCIDGNYLYTGINRLYMSDSERIASNFKLAIDKGIIRPGTEELYIWEKQRDENSENAIKWTLGEGYFFDFYNNGSKKIIFVDSFYQKKYAFPDSSFLNFNPNTEQIVYINNQVYDITKYYLQDSLKTFDQKKIDDLAATSKITYNQKQLLITNDDFDKFSTTGFHENENGIRWTNGNASITFMGDYTAKDSLNIELSTYMPPVCKNIYPKVSLVDEADKACQPTFSKREGDKFIYHFKFDHITPLQKINIVSDTIDARPDVRVLSFPFVSLELKQ